MRLISISILILVTVYAQKSNSNISVSGFDSGGAMAQQLGVGYSKTIKAFGSFAGGAFACYDSSVAGMKSCFNTTFIDYD